MRFFKVKNRISLILLLSLCRWLGHAQGIAFSTYESETVQKTSYSVFAEEAIVCRDSFSLQFDLAIQDYNSFGYIFRLNNRNREENADTYSFVFSYDNDERSYLKFNIEAKECRVADTLCNQNLGFRRWIPIRMKFFLKGDSAHLTIGTQHYRTFGLGLPAGFTPSLLFGSSKFSEEIPSFAIRGLTVSGDNRIIEFPFNESSETTVHDKQGRVWGKAIRPVWLLNRSYYWNLLHTQTSQSVAGYNYDALSGNLLYFDKDSLYTFDTRRNVWQGEGHEAFPMTIYLGTNFFHPGNRSLYIYEVDDRKDSCSVCFLNLSDGKVGEAGRDFLSFQRHHHSSYFDAVANKYYIFGGFGSRQYTNALEVYDLNTRQWSRFPLKGDFVAPRFFSSMGALDSDELLLFGGTGNKSGDQSIGKLYYYDLYRINLRDSTIRKIRHFSHEGQHWVPIRNMILLPGDSAFYTLCYPMQEASSRLQLYRFSLNEDTCEPLGDFIPMESKAILSNANLYYNQVTREFYCCTQEFDEHGGNASITRFYSLSAPAISQNALLLYPSVTPGKYIFPLLFVLLLFLFGGSAYLRRKKKRTGAGIAASTASSPRKPQKAMQANALYLFGEFTILDKEGKDITYLFSSKIKQLFLLTLLHSLGKAEGITSAYIYGLLWAEKDLSSAKNLKGVTINRLRKILENLDGVELVYTNNHYFIRLADNFYCDYQHYLRLIDSIKQSAPAAKDAICPLIETLSRGKFLKSSEEPMFDAFKNKQENELCDLLLIELDRLYANAEYELLIQLAEILLNTDPFNDTALWYLLNASHKMKREEQAMKRYYLYVAEYNKSMGNSYPYSYADLLHKDLRPDFQ